MIKSAVYDSSTMACSSSAQWSSWVVMLSGQAGWSSCAMTRCSRWLCSADRCTDRSTSRRFSAWMSPVWHAICHNDTSTCNVISRPLARLLQRVHILGPLPIGAHIQCVHNIPRQKLPLMNFQGHFYTVTQKTWTANRRR